MLRRLITSLGLVFAVHILVQAQSDCRYTLRGKIHDAKSDKPIADATIILRENGRGVTSDAEGNFIISNLCRQSYTLEMSHVACHHLTKQVEIDGNTEGVFLLAHDDKILENIIIREKRVELASTQANSQLSGVELDKKRGETLGEMLKSLPSVTTLNTGSTVSKPVIQGLHSDRILILNNGVRQEGQQWGLDHAPEIDPFIADKLTVLKGAATVKYGIGAMGGVILVEPRALPDTLVRLHSEATLQGFSNGRTGILSAFVEGKNRQFGWRFQGTGKKSGNLQTPQYFLGNTGVEELNGSLMLGFQRKDVKTEVFYSHFYSKIGIFKDSHIGNLTDLINAIERGKPQYESDFTYTINRPAQRISHDILKIKTIIPTPQNSYLTLQASGQYDLRQEYDAHRPGGAVPVGFKKAEIAFESPTIQLHVDWTHKPVKNLKGSVGTEGVYQLNNTFAGGLIPSFQQFSTGVYAIERWRRFPSPLEIEAGVRYDVRHLAIDSTTFGQVKKSFSYDNISASIGSIYHLKNWGKASFNLSTAWRNPNVNELFSNGVHHGTASFERGDPTLKSERLVSASLGFDVKTSHFTCELNIYNNQINNFIYLQPDSLPVLTIRGAFPSYSYRQTAALLRGGDATIKVLIYKNLWLRGSLTTLYAQDKSQGTWLPLMPPDRLEQGLYYEFSNKKINNGYAELTVLEVAQQRRIEMIADAKGELKIRDYTPAPNGYILLNAAFGGDIQVGGRKMRVSVKAVNILNTRYRDYLDRLRYYSDAMGRNVSVSVHIKL